MKILLKTLIIVYGAISGCILTGCSNTEDEFNREVTSTDLLPYVWEQTGDNEYWIDPDIAVAEKDRFSQLYYFQDDSHGIICYHHYNFDYVGSHHSIDRKGSSFTYYIYDGKIYINHENGTETLSLTADKTSLIDQNGATFTKRDYNERDWDFINQWIPTDSNEDHSSINAPFKFYVNLIAASYIEVEGKNKWQIRIKFGSNNWETKNVNYLSILASAGQWNITNKKEYYDYISLHPTTNGNLEILCHWDKDNAVDTAIWWDLFIYVSTPKSIDNFEISFTPTWSNNYGSYEGETVNLPIYDKPLS